MMRTQSTPEGILEQIRRVAEELGGTAPTSAEFTARSGISIGSVRGRFGCWGAAVRRAGLSPDPRARLSDEMLFYAMRAAFLEAGRVCSAARFDVTCRHRASTFIRRFGSWRRSLLAFREWLERTCEAFPYTEQLPDQLGPRGVSPGPRHSPGRAAGQGNYGEPINFRGMLHAPVNEQGVVFLFGMICSDLGFQVESIQHGYPDCEVKCRFPGRRTVWRRLRIEFEFLSSGFRAGGHDPTSCDLVVCWVHDWQQCPLEVLELRSVIARLPDSSEPPQPTS